MLFSNEKKQTDGTGEKRVNALMQDPFFRAFVGINNLHDCAVQLTNISKIQGKRLGGTEEMMVQEITAMYPTVKKLLEEGLTQQGWSQDEVGAAWSEARGAIEE